MKVEIKTHYLSVDCDDANILFQLDGRFAVPVPNYWFSEAYKRGMWDGKKHFFSVTSKKMPTGLFPVLKEWLLENEIEFEVTDLRKPLKEVAPITKLLDKDLSSDMYRYQAEAVDKVLKAGCGVLEIATNGGKTLIASSIIASLNMRTLFVVNTKELMFQAKREIEKHTGLEVAMLGAGHRGKGFVTVAIANSLNLIKSSNWFKDFEILIVDETHHLPAKTFESVVLKCPARYRLGMSGTAFDGNAVRDISLVGHTGPLLMKISNAELIDRGVSALPTIKFVYSDVDGATVSHIKKATYIQAVRNGIVFCETRNQQIAELAKRLRKEGENILILTPYKRHGYELNNLLTGEVSPLYYSHGSVSDWIREKNLEAFRDDGGVMIATTVYDEGVDIPAIDSLILVGGGKKDRRLLQRIGRGLRKKADGDNTVDVYDFIDWHHKYLSKHSANRLALYWREGFEVIGMDSEAKVWMEDIKSVLSEDMTLSDEPSARVKKMKSQYVNNKDKTINLIRKRYLELRKK